MIEKPTSFKEDENGAAALDYAIIAGILSVVIYASFDTLLDVVQRASSMIAAELDGIIF